MSEPEIIKLSDGVVQLIRRKEAELQAQILNFIEADLAGRGGLPEGKSTLSHDRTHLLIESVGGVKP